MKVQIQRPERKIEGNIDVVSSKSISNRLLILQALFPENISIKNLSEAEDTKLLQQLLRDIPQNKYELNAENAGTVFRFLTAFLSQREGEWLLTGSERMKERPVKELVDALQQLGAAINYSEKEGFPPLKIKGEKLQAKPVTFSSSKSSQFLSALLLIAPSLDAPLEIYIQGEIPSQPYLEMTIDLLEQTGVQVERNGNRIKIYPGAEISTSFSVEPDWSAASYFYTIVALAEKAEIYLKGFSRDSLQGDAVIAVLMESFGVETIFKKEGIILRRNIPVAEAFEFDFKDYPDLVPAVAVACAGTGINGIFKGIENLRLKESDRIAALSQELKKIDCTFEEEKEVWKIFPPEKITSRNIYFQTHGDHRIAMALAPLALVIDKIEIEDHQVVNKSFPDFWKALEKLSFRLKFGTA